MKSNQTSIVILAAGLGSRYGNLKQMDTFGPNGETIMDYSIYDAIQTGFDKIVMIVREDFREEMKNMFDKRFGDKIELIYINQTLKDLPDNVTHDNKRLKPWGTAHALWTARHVIHEPFGVINADDFYGKDAFIKLHEFLSTDLSQNYCVITYQLGNTLSDFGTVNRGICTIDSERQLISIKETLNISKNGLSNISYFENDTVHTLKSNTEVSMNMFGFRPSYFGYTSELLSKFIYKNNEDNKSEFYIPLVIDDLLLKGTLNVNAINTNAPWFGVTYPEDKIFVSESLLALHKRKYYPASLWIKDPMPMPDYRLTMLV